MKTFLKPISLVLLTAVMIAVSACGGQSANAEPTKPATLEKVTVQLSWFHDPEFSGFYSAIEKGFYAEEGLDVTLVAGGPDADPITEVMEGRAQFGVDPANAILSSRANGVNIVAVSCIYKENPFLIMSLPESGIKSPQDLIGKTISVQTPDASSDQDALLLAMLKRMGIDRTSVNFTATKSYNGAEELQSGHSQAAAAFLTNQPVQAKLSGVDVNIMLYKDYGVPFYANLITTSQKLIDERPDLVQKFVRATLRGYQYAIENAEEAAAFTHKYNEQGDPKYDLAALVAMIPLINNGVGSIGEMDTEVWKNTLDIMLEFDLLPKAIEPESAYTNKFVTPQ